MSMQIPNATDPLEPDRLPPDPRTAAMMLLGMTISEMKEVDNNIVGKKSPISSLVDTTSVNKMIHEISTLNANQIPTQQTPTQQVTPTIPAQQSVQTVQQRTEHDPNQLEFDFYKKLKPEDIEKHLITQGEKLKKIENKLEEILELLKKKN